VEQRRRIHVTTLGCPKNQVDSEVMLGVLTRAGHEIVLDPDAADVLARELPEVDALVGTGGLTRIAEAVTGPAAAEPVVKAGGGPNWTFRHTVVTAGKKLVASTENQGLSSRLVNELPQWLCICAVRR